MFANVRVFDSVALASSSSEKLAGDRPPPAVKAKSCASLGCASFTIDDLAALAVRERAGDVLARATSMFATGLPSPQVAEVWSQPPGTVSARE